MCPRLIVAWSMLVCVLLATTVCGQVGPQAILYDEGATTHVRRMQGVGATMFLMNAGTVPAQLEVSDLSSAPVTSVTCPPNGAIISAALPAAVQEERLTFAGTFQSQQVALGSDLCLHVGRGVDFITQGVAKYTTHPIIGSSLTEVQLILDLAALAPAAPFLAQMLLPDTHLFAFRDPDPAGGWVLALVLWNQPAETRVLVLNNERTDWTDTTPGNIHGLSNGMGNGSIGSGLGLAPVDGGLSVIPARSFDYRIAEVVRPTVVRVNSSFSTASSSTSLPQLDYNWQAWQNMGGGPGPGLPTYNSGPFPENHVSFEPIVAWTSVPATIWLQTVEDPILRTPLFASNQVHGIGLKTAASYVGGFVHTYSLTYADVVGESGQQDLGFYCTSCVMPGGSWSWGTVNSWMNFHWNDPRFHVWAMKVYAVPEM